jgi:hypothetical protein
MMLAVAPLLTLSQVEAMDTTYLTVAADYWERTANLWEEVFTEVHKRTSMPGGTSWKGRAAARERERSYTDMVQIRGPVYQLHEAAAIARRGDGELQACKAEVLNAVYEVRADGFDVGEDYSVTDRSTGGSAEFRAERRAKAQTHAAFIRHRVAALVAKDHEIAAQIAATLQGIDDLTFAEAPGVDDTIVGDDKHNGVRQVDNKTLKDAPPHLPEAPNPAPEPPPGGWSTDPLMRAAQKIAYGHASGKHEAEFPGMTKDQLANVIDDMFKRSSENPGSLVVGRTSDGAPVLYDPKTNVMVIRDPKALDAGTVYRPNVPNLADYLGKKIPTRVSSLPPGELADGPLPATAEPPTGSTGPVEGRPAEPRPASPGRPAPAPPPAAPPVEPAPVEPPAPRPAPGIGSFGGGGGGIPGLGHGPLHEPVE